MPVSDILEALGAHGARLAKKRRRNRIRTESGFAKKPARGARLKPRLSTVALSLTGTNLDPWMKRKQE